MHLRSGAIVLWLMVGWAAGHGQALAQPACSVAAFEIQPEATVEACTAVLDNSGLSDADRAETLKIRARSLHVTGRLDDAIKDYDAALLLAGLTIRNCTCAAADRLRQGRLPDRTRSRQRGHQTMSDYADAYGSGRRHAGASRGLPAARGHGGFCRSHSARLQTSRCSTFI